MVEQDENRQMRNFVFTWHNYPENYMDILGQLLPRVNYLVFGREIAPTTGTKHLQGYCELIGQKRFKKLQKTLGYVHNRDGTPLEALTYCKKGGDFYEVGTPTNQGKRNDLDAVREILEDGNERDIVDMARSVQSVRFAQMYLKLREKKRNFKPHVIWLFGESGTGKTRLAHQDAAKRGFEDDLHLQSIDKWFEGYDAHKAVLIDDLRNEQYSFARILNLLDRNECRVENKGGSRQMLAKVMYITCPVHPACVWISNEKMFQLTRRIDDIIEIKSMDDHIIHKGNGLLQTGPQSEDCREAELQEEGDSF